MSSSIVTRSRASKRKLSSSITHSYPTRSQKRRKLNFEENLNPLPCFDDIGNHVPHATCDQMVPDFSCNDVHDLTFDPDDSNNFYSDTFGKCTPLKTKTLHIVLHPKGAFQLLPNEIIHLVFSFLDHDSLGALGLCSTQMCDIVRNYVYTHRGLKQILPPAPISPVDEVEPDLFHRLGKLLKQITLLQPVRSRLKTASFFLAKLEPAHSAICEYHGTNQSYDCFGQLFSTFIAGWEDLDKARAYCIVKTTSKLEDRVNKVLRSVPGSLPYHEKDIRLLHRSMFLSHTHHSDKEYAFWLTQILKPWPITFQARLLYILSAPLDDSEFVSWTNVCACNDSTTYVTRSHCDFNELGRSLRVLNEHRGKNWREEDVISIIEELTITPSGWCLENVAHLLLSCGQPVTKAFLGCRAVSGRIDELSVLCCCLANGVSRNLCSELWDSKAFIKVLSETMEVFPSYINKTDFLSSMMDIWKDCISELFEDYGSDNLEYEGYEEIQGEFHAALESLRQFTLSMLQMNLEKTSY